MKPRDTERQPGDSSVSVYLEGGVVEVNVTTNAQQTTLRMSLYSARRVLERLRKTLGDV